MGDINHYDCFLELVKKRRTIRQFKPDPVPDEYITKIIEAARWAPSGFHTQPWEFVVVRNKETRDSIVAALEKHGPPIKGKSQDGAPQTPPQRSFRDAPVFILLLADWRARVGLPDRVQDNDAMVANLFCSSLASAFLCMHLAAAALGLASQWYTSTARPEAERAIKDIIGIPEALKIYDMMVVGYAANPPVPKVVRDLDDMVHYDDCGAQDFRTDEEVVAGARKTKDWCLAAHPA
jgi:nitroreductase